MLLSTNADVNTQDEVFNTALQLACSGGYCKIVKMLLDSGADVNAQGGYLDNALQAACEGGHEKVVRTLLNTAVDIYAKGGEHGSALKAARSGDHDKIVQMLLIKHVIIKFQNRGRRTARVVNMSQLYAAAYAGSLLPAQDHCCLRRITAALTVVPI
jgi:ankyrin repeat protein